eukprot:999370-Pelagomonas_calceolata.AAC.5
MKVDHTGPLQNLCTQASILGHERHAASPAARRPHRKRGHRAGQAPGGSDGGGGQAQAAGGAHQGCGQGVHETAKCQGQSLSGNAGC